MDVLHVEVVGGDGVGDRVVGQVLRLLGSHPAHFLWIQFDRVVPIVWDTSLLHSDFNAGGFSKEDVVSLSLVLKIVFFKLWYGDSNAVKSGPETSTLTAFKKNMF